MEALDLSVYDSEGNMRSLNDILGDLNTSMDDLLQNVFISKDVCIHSKGNMTAVSNARMTVS